MIKVEHTRIHVAIPNGKSMYHDVSVTDAELVLVDTKGKGQLMPYHVKPISYTTYYSPILISRTEKIEVDWKGWAYKKDVKGQLFEHFYTTNSWYDDAKKVLALPEHFSPEHLQMIVDGKLKDGDKVLVECIKEKPTAMTYNGVNSRGDYLYYCPKCGWGGSYMGIGQVHCYKDECRETTVKLNPHITIYSVEEKMYTREEVFSILQKFHDAPVYSGTDMSSYLHKWFEQNVK